MNWYSRSSHKISERRISESGREDILFYYSLRNSIFLYFTVCIYIVRNITSNPGTSASQIPIGGSDELGYGKTVSY